MSNPDAFLVDYKQLVLELENKDNRTLKLLNMTFVIDVKPA